MSVWRPFYFLFTLHIKHTHEYNNSHQLRRWQRDGATETLAYTLPSVSKQSSNAVCKCVRFGAAIKVHCTNNTTRTTTTKTPEFECKTWLAQMQIRMQHVYWQPRRQQQSQWHVAHTGLCRHATPCHNNSTCAPPHTSLRQCDRCCRCINISCLNIVLTMWNSVGKWKNSTIFGTEELKGCKESAQVWFNENLNFQEFY